MAKKRVKTWKYIFLVLLAIAIILLIVFTYAKDCGEDKVCFDEALESCSRAKFVNYDDNNTFLYDLEGAEDGDCMITVHLVHVGMDVNKGLKESLQGKGMLCKVGASVDVYNTKELNAYCTGPLKEVLLQMTIERLYGFVIKTFGKSLVDAELESSLPYSAV